MLKYMGWDYKFLPHPGPGCFNVMSALGLSDTGGGLSDTGRESEPSTFTAYVHKTPSCMLAHAKGGTMHHG